MSPRWLRILFASLWLLWTGVIIPGHTRGAIPIAESSCCAAKHSPAKEKRPANNSQNCAICHLSAKLTHGPCISLVQTSLALIEIRPPAPREQPSAKPFVLPRQCRDPPAV